MTKFLPYLLALLSSASVALGQTGTTQPIRNGILQTDLNAAGHKIINLDVSNLSFGSYQPLDADLTAIAALTTDSYGRLLLTKTTAGAVRTYIDAQGHSSALDTLSALTPTAVGQNFLTLVNPVATGYVKVGNDIDHTITIVTPASLLTDISAEHTLTFSVPLSRSVNTVSMPQATGSVDGYLASVHWSLFNAKENALSFDAPIVRVSNTITLRQASSTVDGYLASVHWSLFNAKEPGLGNPGVNGYVLSSTTGGTRSWINLASVSQPLNTILTGLSGIAPPSGSTEWFRRSSAGTYGVGTITAYAETFISGSGDAAAARTLLGLGTAAVASSTAFEPALGNPGTNGWFVSSTSAGVRSWAPVMEVGSGVGAPTAVDGNGRLLKGPTATTQLDWSSASSVEILNNTNVSGDLGVSGNLSVSGDIKDANGNVIIGLSPTASAVNHFQVSNTDAAGNYTGLILSAVGSSTDIAMHANPKGTASFHIGSSVKLGGTEAASSDSVFTCSTGQNIGLDVVAHGFDQDDTVPMFQVTGHRGSPSGPVYQVFDEGDTYTYGLVQTRLGVKLSGSTSGTTIFQAAAIAGTTTITLPGVTTTLLGTNAIGSTVQAYDADLTTWAGITPGTGVGTALAINVGSAGAFVTFNGALGTPSSGTLTNCTFPTLNQNTSGSAASLSISGQTGLLTFTGLASTSRIKTVRDAADTILELGGSYTPTGTWTNLTLVTPALGTPSALVLTNATGLPPAGVTGTAAILGANTFTAQQVNSYSGTASTPAMKYSGVPFAGTGTTSFPLVYINDANATASTTLSTAGTYFGVNGDGTQDLMNLLKDGTSMFKVDSGGATTVGGTITRGSTTIGSNVIGMGGQSSFIQMSGNDSYLNALNSSSVFHFRNSSFADLVTVNLSTGTITTAGAINGTAVDAASGNFTTTGAFIAYGAGTSIHLQANAAALATRKDFVLKWNDTVVGGGGNIFSTGSFDTGVSRDSPGVVAFGTGAAGSLAGSWKATNGTLSGTLSVTGIASGPTAAVDTNTTQLATTAYVIGQSYLKTAKSILSVSGWNFVSLAASQFSTADGPIFGAPGYPIIPAANALTENEYLYIVPFACTLKNLNVRTGDTGATGSGTSVITIRKNKVDTTLTVTMDNTIRTTTTDSTHSVSFAAGDQLTFRITPTGGGYSSASLANITMEVDAP